VSATTTPGRRSLHLGSLFAAAVIVGVAVWFAARAFAAGSCPDQDVLRVATSCRALVGSLAGIAAGILVTPLLGRAAAKLVKPGQVVALDGGTTTAQLAKHLPLELQAKLLRALHRILPRGFPGG